MHGGVYVPVSKATPPNPYLEIPNRDIETDEGLRLTLMNPAYMTRQVNELAEKQYGIHGHITSLNPIRPENAADPWETEALKAFENGVAEVSEVVDFKGAPYMRLMRSFVVEEACLKCHASQGYNLGDIRGGISVSIPMAPLWAVRNSHMANELLAHGLLWLFLLVATGLGMHRLNQQITKRERAELLAASEARVNAALSEVSRVLLQQMSIEDISDIVLGYAKDLTASEIGYVGYVDPKTGHLISSTLTRDDWETCRVGDKDVVFRNFTGLWGWVLKNRRPLLTNSPSDDPRSAGTPEGHEPIRRFLSAPAVAGETLVGQIALANAAIDYTERNLEIIEHLATLYAVAVQRKRAEEAIQQRTHDLGERVKELNCLYGLSRLTEKHGVSLEEIFQGTVDLIPSSLQYPDATCARIIFEEREFRTGNFEESAWEQASGIRVYGDRRGVLEVYYLEEMPQADEGPFLKEERDLIDAITGRLGRITERKRAEEELIKHRDHLEELVEERAGKLTTAVKRLESEVAERMRVEQDLRRRQKALESISVSAIGTRGSLKVICDQLVANLSRLLRVSHATVERIEGNRIKIISMIVDGELLLEKMEAPLKGAPCERVRDDKEICIFRGDLSEQFPEDDFFKEHPIRAYLGVPVVDANGEVIAIVHAMHREDRDFSEEDSHLLEIYGMRVEHEMERSLIEGQLRQSQKLEAVGQLAGGMAHDFNNLLTVILGNAEMLQLTFETDNPIYHELQEIIAASHRSAELTRQLLAFSRKQLLQPKIMDINSAIKDMDKMLRRLIRADIDLCAKPAPEIWPVKADPNQIEQVILNLVVNARDAIPRSGRIILETNNVELDGHQAREHTELEPGRHVMLAITDTGEGMSEEVLNHIFEPFYTTKPEGEGTGLGLATVYGIVKQHGGSITVHSNEGNGTTFKIYLPAADPEEEEESAREDIRMPRGSETVLVVEDEEGVRGVAVKVLSRLGYKVFDAPGGPEALALLEDRAAAPDLVITDIVMREMGGVELAEELRRRCPAAKILFMSGYKEDAAQINGFLTPGLDMLDKPFSPKTLAQIVREILDRPGAV